MMPSIFDTEIIGTIIVAAVMLLVPILAGWLLRRHALRMPQYDGDVYPIPPFALNASLGGLVLLVIVIVLPLLAYLTGSDVTWTDVLVIYGAMSLPAAFLVYNLIVNSGAVVLIEEGVVLYRLGRERRMRYDQITSIDEHNWNPFFPSMVLKGLGKRLRINRRAHNLPELHAQIQTRVDALTGRRTGFPFELRIKPTVVLVEVVALFLLSAFLLSLLFVIPYDRNPDPFAAQCIMSTLMIGLLAAIWFGFWKTEVKPTTPFHLICTADQVRFRLPFQEWQSLPADDLIKVEFSTRPVSVRSGGVRVSATTSSLQLLFKDGQSIELDERRCRQMGYTPGRMCLALRDLYPETLAR